MAFVNNGDGTVTFGYTVTNANGLRFRNAINGLNNGYPSEVPDPITGDPIPNPLNENQWADNLLKRSLIGWVRAFERKIAVNATAATEAAKPDMDVI